MSDKKIVNGVKHKSDRTILSFFPKRQKISADENNNSSTDLIQISNPAEADVSENGKSQGGGDCEKVEAKRSFQSSWLRDFSWLRFDREKSQMTCELCLKHKKANALTEGTSNFRTSTLTRHAESKDHQASVLGENMQSDFAKAVEKVMSEKDKAISVALKAVYFLASEGLPMHKYEHLTSFLAECECPYMSKLSHADNASYRSETTANDMLQSVASVIREKIDNKLLRSPFISIFADESTDIGMEKKLVVYARTLDPENYTATTHYLENVKVSCGSGQVVSQAILDCLEQRNVPLSKVMGFGSDGAKAMTGTKEGVTGHLLRVNPMLLNYHCIAHRLALVSSQAADSVPYLKEYQDILTGLFYFFKGSANRNEKLKDIQRLLDEPTLKVKEVHEVRWLSIYKAVETVYRCLDSLLSLFSTEKDPKAKGYSKKLGNTDFISTTYMLMDILPIITELCLVFQKSDLDVSLVQVSVEQCLKDLESYKTGDPAPLQATYLDQLKDHLKPVGGRLMFKDNHIVSRGNRNVETLKKQFVDSLTENLNLRFPQKDSNIIYNFSCLGMRPLSFLSKEELSVWGDEKLEILTNHFGSEQVHEFATEKRKAEPIISAEDTKKEWKLIKPLVVNEGFPRDKLSTLWQLIYKHHGDKFPNLLKLAAIALTTPVHTADCERGFSNQNRVKTSLRNRLSPERVDDLVTVSCEGGALSDFDFKSALQHWKKKKDRRIFS